MNKLVDCVDIVVMTFLKHLIHVFVFLGCLGFIVVLHLIATDSTSTSQIDPYEIQEANEMSAIGNIMSYHPVVFGANKTA